MSNGKESGMSFDYGKELRISCNDDDLSQNEVNDLMNVLNDNVDESFEELIKENKEYIFNQSIRQYAMIKLEDNYRERLKEFIVNAKSKEEIELANKQLDEEYLIYLGEIPNMIGHCIVVGKSGTIYSPMHVKNYIEMTEDEI